MFKKSIIRAVVSLGALAFLLLIYLINANSDAYREYRELVESSDPLKYLEQVEPDTARQIRKQTEKNIFINSDGERRAVRMQSSQSELQMTEVLERLVVMEEMQDVVTVLQKDLYWLLPDGREAVRQSNGRLLLKGADPATPTSWISLETKGLVPMQEVQYFEAENGTYNYSDNTFIANKVTLWHFYTRGHRLPHQIPRQGMRLVMKGIADTITIHLSGTQLSFRAKQLQATLYTNRGL